MRVEGKKKIGNFGVCIFWSQYLMNAHYLKSRGKVEF